jgi:hypothetical protein
MQPQSVAMILTLAAGVYCDPSQYPPGRISRTSEVKYCVHGEHRLRALTPPFCWKLADRPPLLNMPVGLEGLNAAARSKVAKTIACRISRM